MTCPPLAPSRSGRRLSLRRQRGNAIVATTMLIAVVMALAAGLVNLFLVSEAEQVEDSLTQTRVYWAMYGHLRYMLSRAAADGVCDNTTKEATLAANAGSRCFKIDGDSETGYPTINGRLNSSWAGSLQDYLDAHVTPQTSLQNGDLYTPGVQVWAYPQTLMTAADANNPLSFSVRGVVQPRRKEILDQVIDNGELRFDAEVTAVGTAPAVRDLGNRFGRLTVGFCITDQESLVSPTNPTTNGCLGPLATEGQSRIQFIERELPFCYADPHCQ